MAIQRSSARFLIHLAKLRAMLTVGRTFQSMRCRRTRCKSTRMCVHVYSWLAFVARMSLMASVAESASGLQTNAPHKCLTQGQSKHGRKGTNVRVLHHCTSTKGNPLAISRLTRHRDSPVNLQLARRILKSCLRLSRA